MDQNIPTRRIIERRELISLFDHLAQGEEISHAELLFRIGVDVRLAGDKNLVYNVREHCRDVCGFVIEDRGGKFRRVPDCEMDEITRKRIRKIHRQTKRGIAETMAISDWESLGNEAKVKLLAHQSVLGAVHVATRPVTIDKIASDMRQMRELAAIDPYKVIATAAQIEQ